MQINLLKLQSLHNQVEFCKKDPLMHQYLNKQKQIERLRTKSIQQRISLTTIKPTLHDYNMEPRRSVKTTRSQWISAPTPKAQTIFENKKDYFFSFVKKNFGNSQIKGLLNQIHQMVTIIEPLQLCKCVSLKENKFEKTLILDLDETLVHTEPYRKGVNYDHVIRQGLISIGVFVRPYCNYFLEEASKEFELILYTASSEIYANMVLKYIDPKGKYFSAKLYKQHCVTLRNGNQVKNLQILGNRDLKKMVLVDNGPINFQPQPFNGIPIVPFTDEKSDKELLGLLVFLKESILQSINVQTSIKNYFQYQLYRSFQDGIQAFQVLYLGN